MRFPHWMKTVAGALMLTASSGPALAQAPDGSGAGYPAFQPSYGSSDPGVLYPQGVPYGYQPYPAISPYNMGNVAWDETFQDDNGLWFERIMLSNRDYFFQIDATYNTIKDPGSKELGSAHIPLDHLSNGLRGYVIPTYGQGGEPGVQTGGGGGGGGQTAAGLPIPDSRIIVSRDVIPYPILDPTLVALPTEQVNNAIFPLRGMGEFGKYHGTGLEGGWGFFNEDGSGLKVSAFWTGIAGQSFTMGTDQIGGVDITQTIIEESDGRILFTRNGAIPLNWGFQTSAIIPGVTGNLGTAKFDLLYHMETQTSVIGGDMNVYFNPIVRGDSMKLRPLLGGRYMSIADQFKFRGIDSGFSYDIDIQQQTGNGGGGGGGGGATASNTFRPEAGSLEVEYDMVDTRIANSLMSNLAGPQAGLRYDFGEGESFKMWGQSVVGILANREDFHLYGNNVGDQASLLAFGNGLDMLGSDARFNKERTVNHVSPLFEQSINAEMKILEMIPLIRRMPGVEDTVFHVGYTVTVVGGVARSGDSIDWKGFPLFPGIKPGRETWWNSRWNFGLEYRY